MMDVTLVLACTTVGMMEGSATHILAFEGESQVVWLEGNYSDYEDDRRRRLGKDADQPHRVRYRRLTRD